jgi:hypothetical protein
MAQWSRSKIGVGILFAGVVAAFAAAYVFLPGSNGGYRETVTLTSDDPRVAITAVSLYGQPAQAQGIGTPQARFAVIADEDGIPCDTDELEVRTSNNVVHYPRLNICEAHWQIKLTTAAEPPPPNLQPVPELKWILAQLIDAGAPTQALHYAVPETDGTLMTATCQPRSGRITAKFTGSIEALGGAQTARIDFYTPAGVLRYDATIEKLQDAGAEETMPFMIEQSAANPFWQILAGGAMVPFRIAPADFAVLDGRPGAAAISQFVKACSAS